jgi:hypothetical protein
MIRSNTFEVSVEISGKPEIEGIYPDEKTALGRAHDLLKLAKYTAVRVCRVSANDSHKLIFEQLYKGTEAGPTVASIDRAAVCNTASDVYSFDSRMTLLRLLRGYFDQQVIIPLELLHNTLALRTLEREALLFNQAGHRLAAVQAQELKVSPTERYGVLSRLFREVLDLSKQSDPLLPVVDGLASRGLTDLVARVTEGLPPEDRGRAITFGVARYLHEARDWPLKLEAACGLFAEDQSAAAAAWLDEILAEIIDGNDAVKAVLGYAPNLATALEALLAVVEGSWDNRLPGTRSLQKLSDIIDRQPTPRLREALLGRVAAALGGRAPLTKLDRAGNGEALRQLLPRLQEFGGFKGGVAMSVALTRRAKVDFSTGHEDLPFEATVGSLCGFLRSPARKIGYLLDLLSSDLGRKKAFYLTQQIAALFSDLHSVHDLAPDPDSSWSQSLVRQDFQRRLYQAGIPRQLADGLMQKLEQVQGTAGLAGAGTRSASPSGGAGEIGELVLTYQGKRQVIRAGDTPFTIGRGSDCCLVVDWITASRGHAVIEVEGCDFVLRDQSKNGTAVRGAGRKIAVLSKSAIVLSGQGAILIGIAGDDPDVPERAVIGFQRVVPP